jgi:hypothetical protein
MQLLLVAIAVATLCASIAWAIRAPRILVVQCAASAFLTSTMVLSFLEHAGPLTRWFVFVIYSLSLISALLLILGVVRMLRSIGPIAQEAVKVTAALIGAAILLGTIASWCNRYTSWTFLLPVPRITVDGSPTSGYVHLGQTSRDPIASLWVTVRRHRASETYQVWLPAQRRDKANVWRACTEPWFPIVAHGDVIPHGCMFAPFEQTDVERPRNLAFGHKSVEFSADDGVRVRAEW